MTTLSACPACNAAPLAQDVARTPQTANLFLSLPSIHCAACIGGVERTLQAVPGVVSARVNLSLKRVAVAAPDLGNDTLIEALKNAGIEAFAMDSALVQTRRDAVGQRLLVRLAVAGFAMMNVMLFSVAVWSGAADATRDLFHLISAAISLPAVLFCGQPFFASAWSSLRVARMNMDVPISLAILLAAGMSLYEVLNGGAHSYFDAALSLTFFLLIGRYLDHRSRSSARSAARDLAALEVHSAQRLMNGQTETVPVRDLCVGDAVMIPTGVRVPVDGHLTSPGARTDRSFLTGETAAQNLSSGDIVQAGEINLGAPFTLRATAVGEDTTLRRVASLVETAENSRNSYTNLADAAARIYAPAVHLLALLAFVVWVWISGDIRLALNIAVAVLIITCPCALGLAVPAVSTAAIARLYGKGFLVKSGTALERLADVDVAVFDKTGTLTQPDGGARLDHLSDQQTAIARALAQSSDHPVSRAILAALPDGGAEPLDDIAEIPGCGVQARWNGTLVRLGRGDWLGGDFDTPGLRIADHPPISLSMSENPRAGVAEALDGLRAARIDVQILSGDRADAVQSVAQRLGITAFRAGVSATQKHEILTDLQTSGHRALMVGDGLNDTASLAAAHASVAPSSGLDASRNAADVVVLNDSFADLPLLIRVARATTHLSKQNFAIAAAYNCIAVPVALLGYATPLLAALAMSVSSITVLLNAMRVGRVS